MAFDLKTALGLPPPHIKAFLVHAARHSPYYREQDWAKNLLAGLPIRLQDIPITPKSVVQQNPKAFRSEFDPPQAGPVQLKHTSGSTGTSLPIAKSSSHFETNIRENQRLLAPWKIGSIATGVEFRDPDAKHPPGLVELKVTSEGKRRFGVYSHSANDISPLVREHRAEYLSLQPSLVLAMLEDGFDYSFLKLIKTVAEVVTDEFRRTVASLSNCRHVDIYGSVETALIACSCPTCGCYHLARANNLIEILDEAGQPAKPGSYGRIVVTVFSNPATPLIRYDLGDLVRFVDSTPCEPGHVSLLKILGRDRMAFRLPGGGMLLPILNSVGVLAIGIKRHKMVQTKIDEIDFLYQSAKPGEKIDHDKIRQLVASEISPLFKVNPIPVTEFPRAPSGKYIMHERLIP
jgi:phenylacetate-coenzyme A ligase PaaK-like adenylate-forming protein